MTASTPRCHLGCIVDSFGSHPAAWLTSPSTTDCATDFTHYANLAKISEAAKFDFLFVADSPSIPDGELDVLSRSPKSMNGFEPLTLLAALSVVTDRIGMVATASTSYSEPYNIARFFASLDHLSGGRVAWNAVTTGNAAASFNFGRDGAADHAIRYERAGEFIDVVKGLWDSWADDAFISDREAVRYFDPEKAYRLNHVGKHFSVRGPLNIARSPQGQPVLVQAGGSDAGRELAARTADMVFTVETALESAAISYADLKGRMAKYGRDPDALKLMHGVTVVVGDSIAEADEKLAELATFIHEDVGRGMIEGIVGFDLSDIDYDSPIPPERLPEDSNKGKTYFKAIKQMVVEEKRTLRQLGAQFAQARIGNVVIGTPDQICDELELWIDNRACDGFMIRSMAFPTFLTEFCEQVVPVLQERGLCRTEYEAKTLRGHLGLNVPTNKNVLTV